MLNKTSVTGTKNSILITMIILIFGSFAALDTVLLRQTWAHPVSSADDGTQSQTVPAEDRLYVVATSHLDTQWRWTIQTTIDEYLPATLRDNFALFEKYPRYTFSFEGAFRYQLIREYFPEEYEKLKQYIRDDRWHVAGSWLDAVDVNVPSPESLIRQVLYGNGFFEREFDKTSLDVYLPDCFGFGYALPSIAVHCGLSQFSTQKLTWGSSVGIPFDIGLWEGIDGSAIVAALNPGAYVSDITSDLSADSTWIAAIAEQSRISGVGAAYRYYGTGDQGGAPDDESVAWLERSLDSQGPVHVISASSDRLVRDLTDQQIAQLPRYRGELLMTSHGVGCYTSQSAMKRWNRQNELLADAAERASVIAHWLGGADYPRRTLRTAWTRFLWHQFHDDLTGTSIPEAYNFSWNDEVISLNQFAAVLTDAVGTVSRALDTRVEGAPIVVYNPLSIPREDLVEITVRFGEERPDHVRVWGPEGRETPSQSTHYGHDGLRTVFLARVPSLGFAVYDVRPSTGLCPLQTDLVIDPIEGTLENDRYLVRVDQGDINSIYDKEVGRELLAQPIQLQLFDDVPDKWAAWEIDYEDMMTEPRSVVGRADYLVPWERRPARVSYTYQRVQDGSLFKQRISLAAGAAGDRVEVDLEVNWRCSATLLKATFPLSAHNKQATYDLGLGVIQRPTNTPGLYEVPAQQWADLTDAGGDYGVAILSDCRYGWDKPDDHTLRLTLLHTPGIAPGWKWIKDQSSQDLGVHRLKFAICGHDGDWRDEVPWQARRMSQPLLAFQVPQHPGKLGKVFSWLEMAGPGTEESTAYPAVAVQALKLAERSDEIVMRLQELSGKASDSIAVRFARPTVSVREVNGAEHPVQSGSRRPTTAAGGNSGGAPTIIDDALRTDLGPYEPRTVALRLADPPLRLQPPQAQPLTLPHNVDGISFDNNRTDGDFDGAGHSLAAELLPDTLVREDIPFVFGPKDDGRLNVLACRGQTVDLPDGPFNRLYILAAAVDEARKATFALDGRPLEIWIQKYDEPIGQWDNRMVGGTFVEDPLAMMPAYINRASVGWVGTHRHSPEGANEAYVFTHLFKHRIDLADGARSLTLPDDDGVRILAITAARNDNDAAVPVQPLYDDYRTTSVAISAPRRAFVDSARITLYSPNPSPEIHYTVDGDIPTRRSPRYKQPFLLTESATVQATAFSPDIPKQRLVKMEFTRLVPRQPLPVDALASGELSAGLRCRYYESAHQTLPDFSALQPVRETAVTTVAVPEFARAEDIGLVMSGMIAAPKDGLYTFHLWSDDGSALFLGDERVIDNDGLHGRARESAELALAAGHHPITVTFFQHLGGVAFELWWEGPGIELQPVPPEALCHLP